MQAFKPPFKMKWLNSSDLLGQMYNKKESDN